MDTHSVENLLEWLKEKPRTLDWGAIMAYGRAETNKVLLQEYIARFGETSYLKPITEEILDNSTPTQKEYLHNYQLDSPRLSFKDSNLQESRAKLTMHVVGGTHLSFNKAQGESQWSVSRISDEDVLDGPRLMFDINLLASQGSVSSAGRVELDISKGTNYTLTYVQTEHLRKVAGERMQQIFMPLPESEKIFVLNELKFEPDQFLKPARFVIRTHSKENAGATLLDNEDDGEGAVLVFVAMEGDSNGTLPIDNADLMYLLPDGYSALALINQKIVKERVIQSGMNKAQGGFSKFESVMSKDVISAIRTIFGDFYRFEPDISIPVNEYTVNVVHFRIEFYDGGVENQCVFFCPGYTFHSGDIANSEGFTLYGTQELTAYVARNNATVGSGRIEMKHSATRMMEFAIKDGLLGAELKLIDPPYPDDLEIQILNLSVELPLHEVRSKLLPLVRVAFENLVSSCFDRISECVPNIDVFALNSLLFRGDQTLKLESVYFPVDLALFGHVGPTQTTFTINQLEPVIGHSQTFQFTPEPPVTGLKWEVNNILGETSPVGAIDANGKYTAPTAAQLEGNFVRVRVTATKGPHTSSALVTVMRRGITVNPIIQVATAGDPRDLDVSAGTVGGRALDWSIEDPRSGATVRKNPAEGKDHSYFPGPKVIGSRPTVDKIIVRNPETDVAEFAQVLVLHETSYYTLVVDNTANLPDNQVQLLAMRSSGPVKPELLDWTVVIGAASAQIDGNTGILTLDLTGPDRFVVVTVYREIEDIDPFMGHIILPIPLFGVPETIRMLCADAQPVNVH